MSYTWVQAVLDLRGVPQGPKLVLVSLANATNRDAVNSDGDGECWPGGDRIRAECGDMSEASLTNHLTWLRRGGYIKTRRRFGEGQIYTLIKAKICAGAPQKTAVATATIPQNLGDDSPDSGATIPQNLGDDSPDSGATIPQNLGDDSPDSGEVLIRGTGTEPEHRTGTEPEGAITTIGPRQRLCIAFSRALKANSQPTTAVSSTHPKMLALEAAVQPAWLDTAVEMIPEVVRELVGDGKIGPGLYSYALSVMATRMTQAQAPRQPAGGQRQQSRDPSPVDADPLNRHGTSTGGDDISDVPYILF